MFRKTFVEVSMDNIFHNLEVLNKHTNKKMLAVVKANAYGLIDYFIAQKLEEKGVDLFAVSSVEEALRLRNNGIKSDILIMGYVHDLAIIKKNNLSIIIPSSEYVDTYQDQLENIKVHIKVNTGLNRLGIFPNEAKSVLVKLQSSKAIIEGLFTHYACGEDVDYTYRQYYLFKEVYDSLNYKFKYVHTTATDAALYLNDEISNYERIGLGLYGYANIDHDLDLKPALSFKAEVIYSKKVEEGDGVSYSHHYISDGKGYINTVAIGYADGISKNLENKEIYINDEKGQVVGTVCMDLMMVKTPNKHEVGDLVEIFGSHTPLSKRREELGINYCKLLTDISDRVTRVFVENGKIIKEITMR